MVLMTSNGHPARRWRLRDVVIFSLLPFIAALYLLVASAGDYWHMRQFDDWWSNVARVDHFAWWRVRAALHLPKAMALDERLTVEDTSRALVDLRVERDDYDRIAGDPIGRAGESVKASLARDDSLQEVELKLRGDTSVHWTGEKKTLAIKSARGGAINGAQVNVFSCKEVLAQFASNSMAQDFDLLAPPTDVVPVFLNKRFDGMFRNFAPLDETFLSNSGRLSGNVFRGDTAERGDYFKGLPRELFVNPYIWDRVASDARPGAAGMSRLFEFVARVNRATSNELPSSPSHDDSVSRLFDMLDRDEISLLLALELAVGDPWHTSGVHNHFWYEDRSSGRLHPIPWDLRMLDLEHPPPNTQYNHFWRAALRDPRVFANALTEIYQRNRNGALIAKVTQRVEETWQRYRTGFEYDQLRCGPPGTASNSDVGSPAEVLGTLRKNLSTLDGWCNDARASFAITALDQDTLVLDVQVAGRAPVNLNLGYSDLRAFRLTADSDLDGVPSAADRDADDILDLTPTQSHIGPSAHETLWPGVRAMARLECEAISYRYFLKSPSIDASQLSIKFVNAITHADVQPAKLTANSALPAMTSAHPWRYSEPAVREIRLAGDVHLSTTLEVPLNTTLVIEPGAKLVLDPDVSICCIGRVDALGTDTAPITISSADPLHPWGSLALQGEGRPRGGMSLSSEFSHVHFSGGGGARLHDVDYTGMVCVHEARRALFRDCEFSGNQRCEDALHVATAEVTVSRCWFHDSNADAIDFELSVGLIEHCKIERAGKHGIRVRGGSPRIQGNVIQDNLGRGISVAGNSSPLIFANTISGCACGVAAADRAEPMLLNNTIFKNKTGVLALVENPHSGRGGWPRLARTVFSDNGADLTLDKQTASTTMELRTGSDGEAATVADAASLDWLYASNGIVLDSPLLGAVESWHEAPQARVLDEERFSAGWSSPGAIWQRSGGATGLHIVDERLVVSMNATPGKISRKIDWDLTDSSRKNWLVLEASSSAIKFAGVRVERAGDSQGESALSVALELPGGDDTHFAMTVVPLPAGKYSGLSLGFQPYDASGRLCLNGWRVVSTP